MMEYNFAKAFLNNVFQLEYAPSPSDDLTITPGCSFV